MRSARLEQRASLGSRRRNEKQKISPDNESLKNSTENAFSGNQILRRLKKQRIFRIFGLQAYEENVSRELLGASDHRTVFFF